MPISEEQKKELEEIYQSLLNDEKVKRMLDIPMHRGSNCYVHSFVVTKLAMKRAIKKKNINLKALLYACVFHDYYLYDWRKDRTKLKGHGKNHPSIAVKNAKEDFDLPDESASIILSHMWPINFKRYPKGREARLLSFADKKVAIKEAFISKKRKIKNKDNLLISLSKLF